MRRASLLTTLVLATALTAGCSGLFSGPGAYPATETATVTPVDVPEVQTQPAPGIPAPPAAADQPSGPVDAEQLIAADDRIRSNASYRLERVVRIEMRDGDGEMVIQRARRVGTDGPVHERLVAEGTRLLRPSVLNSTLWQDDETIATRATLSNGRPVMLTTLPTPPTRHVVGVGLGERVLRDSELRVQSSGDGTTTLVVEGRVGLSDLEVPVAVGPPRNATARVTVTSAGLIQRVHVNYDTLYLEEPVRVTIRHRVLDVGETTVERPAWVDDAQ